MPDRCYTDVGQTLKVMTALRWPLAWTEAEGSLYEWAESVGLDPGLTNGDCTDEVVSLTCVRSFTIRMFEPIPPETMAEIQALCDGEHPALLIGCGTGEACTFDVFERTEGDPESD